MNQHNPQSDQQSFGSDIREGVNGLYFLADAHATCITMFIRHSFGSNQPGFSGVAALVMMFLTMAGQGDIRMMWFIEAWLVALIFQRVRTVSLIRRGVQEHSYYGGWPWLAMFVSRTQSESHAKNTEPALCFLLGIPLMVISPTIGLYVMFGFVSLLITRTIEFTARRRQVTALRDLQIEQRALSERLRGLRDDF